MHLTIENEEAQYLAQEIARLTGESVTQVVTDALKARLEEERGLRTGNREGRKARIKGIVESIRALPVLDDRTPDAMLYDENGLPA